MAKDFIHDESGATAIEYGLIAALVAVAAIASFTLLGNSLIELMGVGTGGAAETITNQLDKLN